MGKIMPLDLLSSIKGARSSEAILELFRVIRRAVPDHPQDAGPDIHRNAVPVDSLRSDQIERCPDPTIELIRKNFPGEKNGYLVVPKVIED